ncbi:hypothetical protein BH10PSE12_BH10PSE12_20450 [soil metagenome]
MEHSGSATPTVVSLMGRTPQSVDRRSARRHIAVLRIGKIVTGESEQLCMIRNISGTGLMAHVYGHHVPGEHIAIEIKNGHVLMGRVVWSSGLAIGVEFDGRIDVLEFLANEQSDLLEGKVARAPRLKTRTDAVVRRGAHYIRAELGDISQGGACLSEGDAFDARDDVVLMVHGLSPIPGTVCWRREGHVGIRFNQLVPFETLAVWAAQHAPVPASKDSAA